MGEKPHDVPTQPLREICIIQGCLNLRKGSNLCPYHQRTTNPRR